MQMKFAENLLLIVSNQGHFVSAKRIVSTADTIGKSVTPLEWPVLHCPMARECGSAFPWGKSEQS